LLIWNKIAGVSLALNGALLLDLRGETRLPDVYKANPVGYILVPLAMIARVAFSKWIGFPLLFKPRKLAQRMS